jgi:hypothetical protein
MEYLCLVYLDAKQMNELSKAEKEALDRDSLEYDEELERGGHKVTARALAEPGAAMSVRSRGGKAATTDGPFVETKEHLGGFILIEAKDMNEAVRIAAKIPVGRFGGIEVRPTMRLQRDSDGKVFLARDEP